MTGLFVLLLSGCTPGGSPGERSPEARLYKSALHRYKKILRAGARDEEQEKALYLILRRDGGSHAELIFDEIGRSERNIPYSRHLYSLLMEIDIKETVGFVVEGHSKADKPVDRWFFHVLLELYFKRQVDKRSQEKADKEFRRLYSDKFNQLP